MSLKPVKMCLLLSLALVLVTGGFVHRTTRASGATASGACGICTPATVAETHLLHLLNADRAEHGIAPLKLTARLSTVARAHSADMARAHYFGHVTPAGRDPFMRMHTAHISYRSAAENIGMAFGYTPQRGVEVLNAAMMGEPSHRRNHRGIILDSSLHLVGIGIRTSRTGTMYLTEDFTN